MGWNYVQGWGYGCSRIGIAVRVGGKVGARVRVRRRACYNEPRCILISSFSKLGLEMGH